MANLIPPEGDPSTIIDRLLDYVTPVDHNWSHRMRGASIDMIALYAKLAGFGANIDALPMAYSMFVHSMGVDDGGLLRNFRMQARLPSLIRLYQDCLRSEPESLNPDLPVVATYIIGDQISLDRATRIIEPEVVETSDGELIAKLALSWEYLLMQAAILQVEPRRLPLGRWFSSAPNSAARALPFDVEGKQSVAAAVDSLAEKLGLELAWPSDSRHRIAIGKGGSLFANIGTQNEVMIYAFSCDDYMLRQIENDASQILGAISGDLRLVNGELRDSTS